MFQCNLIHSSKSKVGKEKDNLYFSFRKEDFFNQVDESVLLYYEQIDLNVYVISSV